MNENVEKKQESKNNLRKILKNSSFFVVMFILTYYFIFRKINRKGLQDTLSNTNYLFIIIAAILASGNILFEAANLYRNLKHLGEKVSIKNAIKYAVVGFFFSAITPAATGGQPLQIYYMHKDKITYTHATIVILVQCFAYISTMAILAIIGYIVNFNYITNLGFFEYFFFIGIIVNSVIVTFTLIAMFNKKLSQKLVNFAVKIIKKFNEEKANNFSEKMKKQLQEYHDSAKFVVNNKKIMIKTYCATFAQLISYHSVAYFVYLALGIHHLNYFKITSLQSVLYLSVSILPLPGTVGVNETGFSILYNPIIAKNFVDSAMLLTRGISFYLYVVLTGIILIIYGIKKKH